MRVEQFPALALALAVPLLAALWIGGQPAANDPGTVLPLLTLLAISELGLIGCLIATAIGIRQWRRQGWERPRGLATIGCAFAALAFLSQLVRWWPL